MTTTLSSSQRVINQYQQYVIGNYTRYPVCLVRGEGSHVWDAEGHRYLDLFPGWGCDLLGHCPPRVVAAVQEQVAQLIHVPNTWYTEPQGQLAQALSERTDFAGQCFFCNSGAEANEAAIKLARLNNPPGRYKIISMLNSFHGRTMGALSATGQPKYHAGVEPLLPGFKHAPFGDLAAAASLVDDATCAIMVEPIQGEGGVNVPPPGYLEGLRKLCDKDGLLLIFIKPDIVTLAKALAGGVAMGGLIARPDVGDKLKPGTHAATFGGNPVACRAALAAIEMIDADGLLERAEQIGDGFRLRFESLRERCTLIKEVRIKGAMIGLELTVEGTPIVQKCLDRRLLINCTHGTVIRLLPALTLTDEQLDEGCDILEAVLTSQ